MIVGDGPKRAQLEAQAEMSGVAIAFLGHLRGAALWEHVEAADVVALPSIWYEIAPKSILEAQIRSKPTIVSAIGGLPEMVENGVTGRLVAAGDRSAWALALGQMMKMPEEERAQMGARARANVTKFLTREIYNRRMTAIYAKLRPALRMSVAA